MFILVRFWLGNLTYRVIALFAIVFATYQIQMSYQVGWILSYLVTVNFVAFLVYFFDKLIAPIGRVPILKYIFNIRAPNAFLFWELGLLGGGIGALYGIHLTNHKTSDDYAWFRRQLWLISWVVFAGLAYLLWAAIISFADLNSFIGAAVIALLGVAQWFLNTMSPLIRLIS